jgi:HK97 family phage portal protein
MLADHPVMRVLRNPNPRQTSTEFLACMVDDLDTWGGFFARPVYDGDELTELWRMEPERCHLDELQDMSRRVRYTDHQGNSYRLVEGEFWYIPRPPVVDGLRGRSPILDDGREALAVAIALQRYANALFANDATPPFVFRFPNEGGAFKDEQSKKNFLSAWFRHLRGRNRGKPGVLEYGMEIQKLGLTSEEAQFLETRKELWLDLARLWRVPPHMVGIMDQATFSNIEHQSLEFVTHTLTPLLELIERSVGKFLLEDPRLRFEFNVAGLLRGDIKTRYESYALGRQWGWLSVNDILRMEGRNGIGAAGNRYVEPLNMVPVGVADRAPQRRDATADAVAFLRQSVARTGGRPRLEIVKDVA